MTRNDIIRMAREAGIVYDDKAAPFYERFAKLVSAAVRKKTLEEMIYSHPTTAIKQAVEHEREACANVCVDLAADYITSGHPANEISAKVAAIVATRIRARGQQ